MSALRWLAVAVLVLAGVGAVQAGSTTQTFDGGGTAYTLTNDFGPTATVVAAGNPGNAMQLTYAFIGGTQNQIAFDRTQVGPFSKVTANFDFRINNPPGNFGPADGFSFALLHTGTFGASGPGPSFGEEPSLANSFGMEFDTFNNGGEEPSNNYVAIHHNSGFDLAQQDLYPLGFTLFDGNWNHALITIDPVAGGSNVSLTLSPSTGSSNPTVTPFSNVFIAGLNPYESRVAFGARTGGAAEDVLLDNINVSFSAVPEPATLTLLGVGLASLAGCRRVRRRPEA